MKPRTMSRRTLCKTILGMGLLTAIDPLNTLAAGVSPENKAGDQSDELPGDEKEIVTCICGPRFPNGGITIRSKRIAD